MTLLLKHAKKLPIINWNYTFFGAHLQTVDKGWDYPNERHAAFEMIYVLDGTERIEYESYSDSIKHGDFAIISPGIYHHVEATTKLTYFCFHFDLDEPTFEERLISNSKIIYHHDEKLTKIITAKMDKMINSIYQKEESEYQFDDKMEIQLILADIILELYRGITPPSHSESVSTMQIAKIMRVHIKKTLQHQLNQAIEDPSKIENIDIISNICRQLNFSVGYASRIFKSYYGSSPKSYISDIKQEIAQQLLLKPQFNINQISLTLGYKNPGNFSRQFKIWTGLSPKQFRMQKVSHFVDQKLFSENFNSFPKEKINDEKFKQDFWNRI
ncbi:helix-turn-helix domain-containing protein [Paucilactobacillus kaifaensis]|uniref:helix-turn-helix domain-containing protein n=1 Tax=Paucilactobacillus kaifaensis TaxID=2559921 RepID=UPI0010F703C9|nr:helix-turn-helix domain-containing protein [Paucilactobacillus kaifaensis]